MKGFQTSRRRWLLAAVLTCALALTVCATVAVNAAVSGVSITYLSKVGTVSAAGQDQITVKGYPFYTVVNSSKKVAAANQWILANGPSDGVVDISGITAATTLYFGKSTTPALEDVVAVKIPAAPVLSVAKYNADGTFTFQTKVGKANVDVVEDYLEVRTNENGTWMPWKTAFKLDATLKKLQSDGATIYVRIAPAAKFSVVLDGDSYVFVDSNARFSGDTSIVRPGIAKAVKIPRKAYGPALTVDYANHALKVKANQAVGTAAKAATEPVDKDWTTYPTAQNVYFGTNGNVTKELYYATKTAGVAGKSADSLTSFLTVPVDTEFSPSKNPESVATITGGYNTPAVLKIVNKNATNNVGVAYQYAIVDLKNTNKDLIKAKAFNYAQSVEQKVAWKAVKTNKDGIATANIAFKQVEGKQIIVRKAATTTEFSSMVEVFRAPSQATGCWYKVTQAAFAETFVTTEKGGTACPYIGVTSISGSTITLDVFGGTALDNSAITIKDKAGTYTVKKSAVSKNVGTLTLDGEIASKSAVTITFKEGFVKSPKSDEIKVTVKAD